MKRFEAKCWARDPLDETMVLFDHVVQILALYDPDQPSATRKFADHVYGLKPRQIGTALVDSNAIRPAIR